MTDWTGPSCPLNNDAETQGLPALREAVAAVHYSRIRAEQLGIAAPQELVLLTMQASLVLAGLLLATAAERTHRPTQLSNCKGRH